MLRAFYFDRGFVHTPAVGHVGSRCTTVDNALSRGM